MVTTGYPLQKSIKTEIIDLKMPENSCWQEDDFPVGLIRATGGLVRENVPLICGGFDVSWHARQECYLLTNNGFSNIINMTKARVGSSAVVQNQDLVVFGGVYYEGITSDHVGISSIERVSIAKQSSDIIGEMPFTFSEGCIMAYNEKKVMAISGLQDEYPSPDTWTSSFDDLANWRRGPSLNEKRSSFGCSMFHHFKMAIVVGGYDRPGSYLATTELIELNENKVLAGKK